MMILGSDIAKKHSLLHLSDLVSLGQFASVLWDLVSGGLHDPQLSKRYFSDFPFYQFGAATMIVAALPSWRCGPPIVAALPSWR